MDNTIHWINLYPLDSDYPVDSAIRRLNNLRPDDYQYCATLVNVGFPVTFSMTGFLLELQRDGGKMADTATLLSLSDNIHLVLIKTDPSGDTTLIASHFLAWRDILLSSHGRLTCSVEINGVGAEAKVPMGILDVKFEIIPRFSQVMSLCLLQG